MKQLRIVVLGYIVRGPLGGLVWHHFQYVYGLLRMGHDVLYVEDSEEYPACYDPSTYRMTTDPSYGLSFIHSIFSRYGIGDKWAYYDFHTDQWHGRSRAEVHTFLRDADLLLNLSGINPLRDWYCHIQKKIFIDTDPVFTQVRHLRDPKAYQAASEHDIFLTFGENYGKKNCTIPRDGLRWRSTRQPVIPELWQNNRLSASEKWTTVMQWDSYKTANWEGRSFGLKSHSFESFRALPSLIPGEYFELALGSESAPVEELRKLGWLIEDPLKITLSPSSYRDYIRSSKGEWSVAKHGYINTRSGWFSERSAVYLASGKPVVVQDTGFSDNIPVGQGLFGFSSIDELPGIFLEVNANYSHHRKKAREVCQEYFNYRKVLNSIIMD